MFKESLKKIYNFSLKTFSTFISILCVIFFSSFKAHKNIEKIQNNLEIKEECIVLGNGPSVNRIVEILQRKNLNVDIFAVNFFCLTDYFQQIKPKFYVLLDPNLFSSKKKKANSEKIEKLISSLNHANWNITVFVPYKYSDSILTKELKSKFINVCIFNSTPVDAYSSIERLLFKLNLGMPFPQTVINAAIFLAVNLRYKFIHLFGTEQSWLKDLHVYDSNELSVNLDHFYEGDESDKNHSTLSSLSTFLKTQAICFESHMRLEKYAKKMGVKIINRTPNSYIDAYEKRINEW